MTSINLVNLNYNNSTAKRNLFNNTADFGAMIISQKHNNLRVISTPEFPVPYYQRIIKHPASPDQVTIDLRGLFAKVDDFIVSKTMAKLEKSSEGLKVLEYVQNQLDLTSNILLII